MSGISVYVPQCSLDDSQNDNFDVSLFKVIVGDFNGHVGRNAGDSETSMVMLEGMQVTQKQHGGRGRILQFCTVKNLAVKNTLFKTRASHLVNFELGPSKT